MIFSPQNPKFLNFFSKHIGVQWWLKSWKFWNFFDSSKNFQNSVFRHFEESMSNSKVKLPSSVHFWTLTTSRKISKFLSFGDFSNIFGRLCQIEFFAKIFDFLATKTRLLWADLQNFQHYDAQNRQKGVKNSLYSSFCVKLIRSAL